MEFKHTDSVDSVITRCQDLINEYQKSDLGPDKLKYIEKKLAGYFSFLIRRKADAQANQNTRYWVRKISHSRESIKARSSASSQGEADHIALQKIKKEIEDETFSVWVFEDLSGFCKAMEKVFISLSHQLKDYEKEKVIQR
jgi:hypothetical protein